ncbi:MULTISPECIES: oxygen-independent coproporphyrinogen III oxidase [Vitreoscilla]|uniref:Coproporphyrinogen-III oxidase n=1 Tax=Vitreoscilla stercoraria TaxID=61 RepID=A0ABY4E855_VITST|nr:MULTISPECIES: oxygen-independent coproporphyrinogen III oxidase [Vitreoscilla]AUZ04318.2 oxygen-independent coproporphyrinogen 3 oxidase [Vitreoscilla sp. C1]UOO91946.1 oxygen-independent coproporphyrinogen III oxidase [Vitreoscilla stercoraria]
MFTYKNTAVDFDRPLVEKLFKNGPRYTSYPTVERFDKQFGPKQYLRALHQRQAGALSRPLSLYVHIPFCDTVCYYCGCNKIVTKNVATADEYVAYLGRELDLIGNHLKGQHQLAQLHFGGGTPTFLTATQLTQILEHIQRHFQLSERGEYSIEIDPRQISVETVYRLRELGFNRLSVGVQDFDESVQKAVNRVQSVEHTRAIIEAARAAKFHSVNVDLIYGLPHQSLASMQKTLQTVIELDPDRLAFYQYAHMPHMFMPQRRIDDAHLPSSKEKMDILQWAVNWLTEQDYVFIGMDHFAKPTDELAVAFQQGRLQRNFQGYSTHGDCDLVGVGVSSIGKIGASYVQNEKDLQQYYQSIDEGRLPTMRGFLLTPDDILRRGVIHTLMCQSSLLFEPFEEQYGILFQQYFAEEWPELLQQEEQGLIRIDRDGLDVTPKGRFLIRNVAMVFDRYLRHFNTHPINLSRRYSSTY